jgi:putative flippase GtrA
LTWIGRLIVGETRALPVQILRYIVVGGVAAVVDTALLLILANDRVGVHYQAAGVIGFCGGLLVNYVLARIWVFPDRRHAPWKEFSLFAVIGVVGVGLNALILRIGVNGLHAPLVVAKMVSLVIVFAWNFGARRVLVF